jgi:AcrR family transcriptional regulator
MNELMIAAPKAKRSRTDRSASSGVRPGPKRRLNELQWFDAALSAMAVGGVEAIRIDQLAAKLGVTKGSFYVLFKSREVFLEGLLDHWRRISTLQVIEELRAINESPIERLIRVFDISLTDRAKRRARIEAGFRLWAYDDARAAGTMREIDHHRLLYFQSVAEGAGLPAEAAKARAFLIYAYMISDAMLAGDQHEVRLQCRTFLSQGTKAERHIQRDDA